MSRHTSAGQVIVDAGGLPVAGGGRLRTGRTFRGWAAGEEPEAETS